MTISPEYTRFKEDTLRLLNNDPSAEPVIQLAWDSSLVDKNKRIEMIEKQVAENGGTVTLSGRDYDVMELVISLAHYKRSII
jgi:hypothetical protein